MNLFQRGQFKLHSGGTSEFKIDADVLGNHSIETVAWLLAQRVEPFGVVYGIPSGGLRLARAMEEYQVGEGQDGYERLLIVDDVLTTGQSMVDMRASTVLQVALRAANLNITDTIGGVIFARPEPAPWITALWTLAPSMAEREQC